MHAHSSLHVHDTQLIHLCVQVLMHVHSPCKMGISFWPAFSFNPPARDSKPGRVQLMASPAAAASHTELAPSAAAEPFSSSEDSATDSGAEGGADGGSGTQQLQVNFTTAASEPVDEFKVGASFVGGIPFPFLSIRTTKLQVGLALLPGRAMHQQRRLYACLPLPQPST